jgi:PD-(D/E)XK endonuclease
LGISEDSTQPDLSHINRLGNKQRGDVAEMVFMRKASSMGFAVAKPWADGEPYDFVVRAGRVFWRVQVKSVRSKRAHRKHYRVLASHRLRIGYTADEIDFLAAYIFPEDTWYIFPVAFVETRKVVCVTPKSKRSAMEKYREAWKLMEQPSSEFTSESSAVGNDPEALPDK